MNDHVSRNQEYLYHLAVV